VGIFREQASGRSLTIQEQGQSCPDGARMRVKIAHSRSKREAKHAVERSIEQVFAGFNLGPIEFIDQQKHWSGDTMTFSLTAKLGFLQTPIRGLAIVTDQEVALEVDLGLLGKLIPEQAARTQIEGRVKGLLK
jgi:hypothetical protein